jgi:1-acyl-sn-glycerol-3-phosphate acyltransferase
VITSALPAATTAARNLPVDLLPASAETYERLAAPGRAQPVHLFPEGGMTHGRGGMMRWSRGFMRFASDLPVVPVALRLTPPAFAAGVRSHTLTSSFVANLFWLSFLPSVRAEATALPPMRLAPGETKAAFVARVQAAVADELRAPVRPLAVQQKRKLAAVAAKAGGRPPA